MLPSLKVGDKLTHEFHALSVHTFYFLQRFFQKSGVHVETGHISAAELLPELQCRVIHFTDSVKTLHRPSVIRIYDRAAKDRDSCLRQV